MTRKPLLAIGLSLALGAVATLAILMLPAGIAAAGPQAPLEVIATGLDSPRHMAFDSGGALYVAEAGTGGPGPCVPSAIGPVCLGNSGAVTRIDAGTQQRVVTGLASLAAAPGPGGLLEALGPHDVLFDSSDTMFLLTGLATSPIHTVPATGTLHGQPLAVIVEVGAGGTLTVVADIGAFELSDNPDGGLLDTNPFTFVDDGSGTTYVADAGGNAVLDVAAGTIASTAVFSDRLVTFYADFPTNTIPISVPMQAVPTSVEIGPGGDLFVGQLTGFPFPVGEANVYQIPSGGSPSVYASNLSAIVDIDFDGAGNLYVLEMATNGLLNAFVFGDWTGALKRIDSGGGVTVLASTGLVAPTGMTIGPDNRIYISNYGIFPGQGQVVRMSLVPTGVSLSDFGGQGAAGVPIAALVAVPIGAFVIGLALWWRRRDLRAT